MIGEYIFELFRGFGFSISRFFGKTTGIPRRTYVQRVLVDVEPDHHVPPVTVGEQTPILSVGMNNEGVVVEPIVSVEVENEGVGGEPIMEKEVDNEVVGGGKGVYGSVVGRLLIISSQFVEKVEEPNAEGDINKLG